MTTLRKSLLKNNYPDSANKKAFKCIFWAIWCFVLGCLTRLYWNLFITLSGVILELVIIIFCLHCLQLSKGSLALLSSKYWLLSQSCLKYVPMFFIPLFGLTEIWYIFVFSFQDLLGLSLLSVKSLLQDWHVSGISRRMLIFISSVLNCPRQSDPWVSHKAAIYFLEFNSPFLCSTANSPPAIQGKIVP